jgi:hypothetical protein
VWHSGIRVNRIDMVVLSIRYNLLHGNWYVSNVSIIFLCFMLVYIPFLCVLFTLRGVFMYFSELTYYQDDSVSSCFLLFLCFRKVTQEIFSKLDKTKAEVSNYLTRRRSLKESRRRTKGPPHQVVAWATPRSRHQVL